MSVENKLEGRESEPNYEGIVNLIYDCYISQKRNGASGGVNREEFEANGFENLSAGSGSFHAGEVVVRIMVDPKTPNAWSKKDGQVAVDQANKIIEMLHKKDGVTPGEIVLTSHHLHQEITKDDPYDPAEDPFSPEYKG